MFARSCHGWHGSVAWQYYHEKKPKLRCYEQKRLLEIMLFNEISPLWKDWSRGGYFEQPFYNPHHFSLGVLGRVLNIYTKIKDSDFGIACDLPWNFCVRLKDMRTQNAIMNLKLVNLAHQEKNFVIADVDHIYWRSINNPATFLKIKILRRKKIGQYFQFTGRALYNESDLLIIELLLLTG